MTKSATKNARWSWFFMVLILVLNIEKVLYCSTVIMGRCYVSRCFSQGGTVGQGRTSTCIMSLHENIQPRLKMI